MNTLLSLLLIVGIVSGQLIKIPVGGTSGIILLDLAIVLANLFLLIQIKLHFKKPSSWINLFLVFLLLGSFSLLLNPLKLDASQIIISFAYVLRFSNYLLLAWLLSQTAYSRLTPLLISGASLAFLGLLQLIFIPDLGFLAKEGWDPHYFRVVSTFLDPNFLGSFLVLTLLILISPLSHLSLKLQRSLFLIIFIALLLTFSRSAYLMFTTTFFLYSFLQKSLKLGIISALLVFLLAVNFSIYQNQIAKERNIDRNQSAGYRLLTWQQGLSIFQQNPLLGVGFNSYRYALEKYHLAPDWFTLSRGASANDSSLLFVAATTGALGLTAYLSFLATLGWQAWKSHLLKKYFGAILLAGVGGLIVNSFFINSLFYPPILLWIFFITPQAFLPSIPTNPSSSGKAH